MSAISIHLPDKLAEYSQKVAVKLHMSRAQFIRMAIEHELSRWKAEQEQLAIAKSFAAMRGHKRYLHEAMDIMDELNAPLNKDKGQWWKK
ncbi:MAG: hypothetical protein A3J38_05795 [Gammaproteobacteria bacterium RIFCSPHIGHO2_12_FULL_45_9]|nr:MAG: hypothetical protein A3J38_05795 [Gammaproteobacteria bacterium RIFCSPHIGHO2_12_FULL_45_9]